MQKDKKWGFAGDISRLGVKEFLAWISAFK